MTFGLKSELIEKINAIFAKYSAVEEVIIFGSRAKGNYKTGSDIDLCIKGEQMTDAIKSNIAFEIDELNTPYLFDILIFDNLKAPTLKQHINRIGIVFYKSKRH